MELLKSVRSAAEQAASRVSHNLPAFRPLPQDDSSNHASSAIPDNPDECRQCRCTFGVFNPRLACPFCDHFYCGRHYGPGRALIKCIQDRGCKQCADRAAIRASFFSSTLPVLEAGTTCMLHRQRPVAVWISLDTPSAEVRWRTMEMRSMKPVESGAVHLSHISRIDDTYTSPNSMVINSKTGAPLPLEFTSYGDWKDWLEGVRLAVELLVPEQEKQQIEASRQRAREDGLEERQREREERKKKYLATGMGMRFTAEAMAQRGAS
ncbi:unnamed protein product [Vitrella brassicaformis CCMP3155]|uniref:FYVE-type domain-containing protein n=2 Tax=Vitrella brassicaformis TaxID=1169539 RepID=A0A0G4FIX1_VITBC|nr:unnamed protein product [Vitrella brassicaformis CCMP3155]|eukprot:CEM13242.1 unnamed protein product [Vitrella brassicaformis CCMP3155]